MRSDGIVICVMAHAIKWPPGIREFRRILLEKLSRPINAEQLVIAYHETVSWADGKMLKKMHVGLSVGGQAHATTGLMITAKQLGLITPSPKTKAEDVEDVVVRLGLTATPYALKPRKDCSGCDAIVKKFIDDADAARIQWPCQGGAFEDFAGQIFDLVVYLHALKSNGFGLDGGRKIVTKLKREPD